MLTKSDFLFVAGFTLFPLFSCTISVTPTSSTWQKERTGICDQTFSVAPGMHRSVKFSVTVTDDSRGHTATGTFSASGGSGNDIEVYIFDEATWNSYDADPVDSYTALYSSGRISSGSFAISITTSGNYYIVLDNHFSIISSKSVEMDADLDYEVRR